jgi:hypothetical protein
VAAPATKISETKLIVGHSGLPLTIIDLLKFLKSCTFPCFFFLFLSSMSLTAGKRAPAKLSHVLAELLFYDIPPDSGNVDFL